MKATILALTLMMQLTAQAASMPTAAPATGARAQESRTTAQHADDTTTVALLRSPTKRR